MFGDDVLPIRVAVALRGHGEKALETTALQEFFRPHPKIEGYGPPRPPLNWSNGHGISSIILTDLIAETIRSDTKEDEIGGIANSALTISTKELREYPLPLYKKWRDAGRSLDVLVYVCFTHRQIQFTLPAEFVAACNEFLLPIEIRTASFDDDETE